MRPRAPSGTPDGSGTKRWTIGSSLIVTSAAPSRHVTQVAWYIGRAPAAILRRSMPTAARNRSADEWLIEVNLAPGARGRSGLRLVPPSACHGLPSGGCEERGRGRRPGDADDRPTRDVDALDQELDQFAALLGSGTVEVLGHAHEHVAAGVEVEVTNLIRVHATSEVGVDSVIGIDLSGISHSARARTVAAHSPREAHRLDPVDELACAQRLIVAEAAVRSGPSARILDRPARPLS